MTNYTNLNKNKEEYIAFCEKKEMYIPIFSQPWWLEAVSQGNWDVILIKDGNRIVACHPFFYIMHPNGEEIRKATLTQNNGVLINYPQGIKYVKKLSIERKLMGEIIDALEKRDLVSYRQYFHYSLTNWLPFYWKGYYQTTRYTYVIRESNIDRFAENMDAKLRNQIKKADSLVNVFEGMDIKDFFEFNKLTYKRQNLEIPYSLDVVERIEHECSSRGASKILYAKDSENNFHAAIYLVEDDYSVYYLLSASDERFRNSQALSLLLKKGIEYALSKHKLFDFEGSMKENIEHNFSQFGAIQVPYMDIKKVFKGDN